MAERFSKVDPELLIKVMEGWKKDRATSRLPRKLERLEDLPGRLLSLFMATSRKPRK